MLLVCLLVCAGHFDILVGKHVEKEVRRCCIMTRRWTISTANSCICACIIHAKHPESGSRYHPSPYAGMSLPHA
jgi:hypothetical protein